MPDTHSMTPPRWADAWLRTLLSVRDRETVSGDLLEEYRENVRPQRSRLAADLWYVAQVSVFAWRPALWAVVLAAMLVGRTALDWFVPAANLGNALLLARWQSPELVAQLTEQAG